MAGDASSVAAMAAAVAAAAEIAKNSNIYLYDEESSKSKENDLVQETHTSVTADRNTSVSLQPQGEENDSSLPPEEDAEKRLARSRERNREHARRTRLRKKAQLEALQTKVKGLEAESRVLKQSIEECSIASILIGLSSDNKPVESLMEAANLGQELLKSKSPKVSLLVGGKRKRFLMEGGVERSPQPLKLNIDGHITLIGGGKTHINWKSGVYCDENGVQQQLTQEQLESLRRERNRLHAKMTRDRKKCFVSHVEKTIEQLESENKRMRDTLSKVALKFSVVTPTSSPLVKPAMPAGDVPEPSVTPEPSEDASSVTLTLSSDQADVKETPVPHGLHVIA